MKDFNIPWMELAILVPLIGGVIIGRMRDADAARKWCLVFTSLAFLLAVGEYIDFQSIHDRLHVHQADDPGHLQTRILGREIFVIDEISAPLLALGSLLYALTAMATVRTKVRRFSFAWTLYSESILLATFCCREPWIVIGLLSLSTLLPYLELRARGKPTRVFVVHMGAFILLMIVGWCMVEWESAAARSHNRAESHTIWSILPILVAVLIRAGIAPFHCWVTDLFEHITFGTALLFLAPLVSVYAALRLLMPIAPDEVLRMMGVFSLVTAVYAAGMSLVQREGRRFFCYLFLSHSALIFVGLEMMTPLGLTGALSLWLSAGLSLGGLGLTLRALEARRGRLALNNFQGLYEHSPTLAVCFALTGLASVGFPGTMGFIGSELLVDGAVEVYPYVGACVVIASALNGIAIVKAYFLLFTGTRYVSSVNLGASMRERFAVLVLAALLLIGGLIPQYNVGSRHEAALELQRERHERKLDVQQLVVHLLGFLPADNLGHDPLHD